MSHAHLNEWISRNWENIQSPTETWFRSSSCLIWVIPEASHLDLHTAHPPSNPSLPTALHNFAKLIFSKGKRDHTILLFEALPRLPVLLGRSSLCLEESWIFLEEHGRYGDGVGGSVMWADIWFLLSGSSPQSGKLYFCCIYILYFIWRKGSDFFLIACKPLLDKVEAFGNGPLWCAVLFGWCSPNMLCAPFCFPVFLVESGVMWQVLANDLWVELTPVIPELR